MKIKKRIIQILPVLAYGDAIGNNVLAIDDALAEAGYDTLIYADTIDRRIERENIRHFSRYEDREDQLIIYHLSTGSWLNRKVASLKGKLVIHYHNITPPSYFEDYNYHVAQVCREGLEDAVWLRDKAVFCIADSEYNKQDLERMGYCCPIEVLPILIAFDEYRAKPDQDVINEYKNDGRYHIIFTGRVAPNKKQEDLIRSFAYYHKYCNPSSMLHIVGGVDADGWYLHRLSMYIEYLELSDSVHFTRHIPFNQVLSYYRIADLFLCLSEHEGFCVPLVEAMMFKVPIIAYDAAAVGETLGDAGILLKDKSPQIVGETISYLQNHRKLVEQLKEKERIRLHAFSNKLIKGKMVNIIQTYYVE